MCGYALFFVFFFVNIYCRGGPWYLTPGMQCYVILSTGAARHGALRPGKVTHTVYINIPFLPQPLGNSCLSSLCLISRCSIVKYSIVMILVCIFVEQKSIIVKECRFWQSEETGGDNKVPMSLPMLTSQHMGSHTRGRRE